MVVGNLGSLITFEVSSNKVLTFKKLTKATKGRWATHELIGQKPKSEFLGPDQGNLSLSIYISATHGVRPRATLESINDAVENGTPLTFVVGGRQIGNSQWVITDCSETWGTVIKDGKLITANVTLTLKEYV